MAAFSPCGERVEISSEQEKKVCREPCVLSPSVERTGTAREHLWEAGGLLGPTGLTLLAQAGLPPLPSPSLCHTDPVS